MTAAEYRQIRETLGLTHRAIASWFHACTGTSIKWAKGKVPHHVAAALSKELERYNGPPSL